MPKITIEIGEDYATQLKARLEKHAIGQGELAREMGVAPSQVSRWITGAMGLRMSNVQRLEEAVFRIRQRRRGAPATTPTGEPSTHG